MARSAPRLCTHPGCQRLAVDGTSRCDLHPQVAWAVKRATPVKRITGRKLQARREQLFKHRPLCAMCLADGRTRLATQRDHIVPMSEGGDESHANEQGLCDEHHAIKSRAEAVRARWGAPKS